VSAHQLLPDYLTHQEFLKPQLQAAGFSGGRIIAGPFPVPLARLPKPPARSSSVSPTPIPPVEPVTTTTTTTAAISKIKPPQQVQSSLPTFIYKATPLPLKKMMTDRRRPTRRMSSQLEPPLRLQSLACLFNQKHIVCVDVGLVVFLFFPPSSVWPSTAVWFRPASGGYLMTIRGSLGSARIKEETFARVMRSHSG
jgi:hypothetical protein